MPTTIRPGLGSRLRTRRAILLASLMLGSALASLVLWSAALIGIIRALE
jgi:hypothetical protein